jgi:tetratricopeptide (TPR) repeat protein
VLHLGDTIQWIKLLDEGVDKYPGCNYFFLNMMEHYMREGQLSKGLARIDSLVRTDGDRAVYWFAMSMFALEQGEHEKCVRMSDECLKRDSTNIDAYYNKGISLLNMTLSEDDIKARRKLFQQALKPMEKVRELSPESIDRWGNPLYRIYLNLNMGKKFEEIDTLLEKHNNGVEQKETETIIHKVDETGNKRMDKQLGR